MRTRDQIVNAWKQRQKAAYPTQRAGSLLRRVYNGELPVAMPEISKGERAAIANLIQTGLDEHGRRIGSVDAVIECPPIRVGEAARQRADNRKYAAQAWLYQNRYPIKRRRRARHLIGYASSPVLVRAGRDGIPIWEVRDPLATYPAPCEPDELVPPDCIFEFKRTLAWLRTYHTVNGLTTGRDAGDDTQFTILAYYSADQCSMIAMGNEFEEDRADITLIDMANPAGRPLVVVPGRVTLDRLQGQFDQMVGMYETQAKLWALHLEAVTRAIFGETYAEFSSEQADESQFEPANPYDGTPGLVKGGRMVTFRPDPGFQTLPSIDRLERAQRVTGAVPAEFGGEGATNVRTGRRGSQVMESTIDSTIQEHQELLALSLQEELEIAYALASAHWPNESRTFLVPGLRKASTYVPSKDFETDSAVFCSYAYAGTDTGNLVIEAGQRLGMETLSHRSFMEIDPMVRDVDTEHDRIVSESIERAQLQAILAQSQDPASPWQPAQLARLDELTADENMPLSKAVLKVQAEAQQMQAQAAQGQLPTEQMQPGLAQQGAPGTAEQAAAVPQPGPSMDNLSQLLGQLTATSRAPG